jgi:hypothetical protein
VGTVIAPTRSLELPYRWNEVDGVVRAEIGINDDPGRFGGEDFARGFPYCRATIEPPACGYNEMLGWIQLVDTDEQTPGFQVDFFEPLGRVPHPFAFFGFSPVLFDSPHTTYPNWDFVAHSFLCGLGGKLLEQTEEGRHEVRPVLGFEWGFTKRGAEIDSYGPEPLSAEDWNGHLHYLRGAFSGWEFLPGFFDHALP